MSDHYIRLVAMVLALLMGLPLTGQAGQLPALASPQDSTAQGDGSNRPAVERERIEYRDEGRRDPFRPLIEKKDEDEEELPLMQIEKATLVGLMNGPTGSLALVKDAEERTYVLHEGARIKNGYLSRVKSGAAVFHIAKYGRYRTIELELRSEKRADSFERGVLRARPPARPVARPEPAVQVLTQPEPRIQQPLPEGTKFTLQVAAFRQESQAQRLQQWMQMRGYQMRIEEVNIPESGRWFRVRYGVYDNYDAVRRTAEDFRQRFDFYCWIVPIES